MKGLASCGQKDCWLTTSPQTNPLASCRLTRPCQQGLGCPTSKFPEEKWHYPDIPRSSLRLTLPCPLVVVLSTYPDFGRFPPPINHCLGSSLEKERGAGLGPQNKRTPPFAKKNVANSTKNLQSKPLIHFWFILHPLLGKIICWGSSF